MPFQLLDTPFAAFTDIYILVVGSDISASIVYSSGLQVCLTSERSQIWSQKEGYICLGLCQEVHLT